jgi:hypothetical protein
VVCSTPPLSAVKTLRLLESAYARQGMELDEMRMVINRLKKQIKTLKALK